MRKKRKRRERDCVGGVRDHLQDFKRDGLEDLKHVCVYMCVCGKCMTLASEDDDDEEERERLRRRRPRRFGGF